MKRLLLGGSVVLLPLLLLTAAINLTVRLPDFYQFEFNRNETPKALELNIKSDELADFFSGFMFGDAQRFELILLDENTEEQKSVFSESDREAMERFRSILNAASMIAAAFVIPLAAVYVLLLRSGKKELLRRSFLASIAVFVPLTALCGAGLYYSGPAAALQRLFFGGPFSEESLLSSIFTREFVLHGAVASAAIAVVTYIIVGMVTWSMTRPYRMFSRQRRERG